MSKFNIQYKNIFNNLLPRKFREKRLLNYLYSIAAVLQGLNNTFASWRDNFYEFLLHDSREIYFEKYLNDLYDPTIRGIYIDTLSVNQQVYLYNEAEAEDETILYNIGETLINPALFNEAETLSTENFEVFVPVAVSTSNTIIAGTIDKYKLAGKTYKITRY